MANVQTSKMNNESKRSLNFACFLYLFAWHPKLSWEAKTFWWESGKTSTVSVICLCEESCYKYYAGGRQITVDLWVKTLKWVCKKCWKRVPVCLCPESSGLLLGFLVLKSRQDGSCWLDGGETK